jgi:serine/threonine protein kinase
LQVSLALRYMHDDQGVVHRDITPANILVDRDLRKVRLVDFGLAIRLDGFGLRDDSEESLREKEKNDLQATPPTGAVGTMPYTCPESLSGDKNHLVCAKADVWSFGCVMYHAMVLEGACFISQIQTLFTALYGVQSESTTHSVGPLSNPSYTCPEVHPHSSTQD